jgi:hypothetical protein
MADKDPVWSYGDSCLLYSPTTGLDSAWSLGESVIFDEYAAVPVSAAITGTSTASITEADIVTGGKTIIITLSGDHWITN